MATEYDDDCGYCGAPAFLQDGRYAAREDEPREPGRCSHCGALVDDEGKVFGP